jgi:arylsulfatase
MAFNKSIFKYPNIKRFPGGASNDLLPDLQHPENPVQALDVSKATTTARMGGD